MSRYSPKLVSSSQFHPLPTLGFHIPDFDNLQAAWLPCISSPPLMILLGQQ